MEILTTETMEQTAHFSVYIHIPFCERKCSYCNFVSFENLDKIDKYVDVLCDEIKYNGEASSVYIGGGTPSVLSNTQLTKIFSKLKYKSDAEITIEANPNSVTYEKLEFWRELGINRVSIGVQSFDDKTLNTLGRVHTASQAIRSIEMAREAGFANISIDLMHSVPGHKFSVCKKLERALALATHVSAYCLTLETGTKLLKQIESGEIPNIDEERSIEDQRLVEETLLEHGFKKYEVSNFSKRGFESKHNMAYWMPDKCQYLGFGVAAHSFYGERRFSNTENLEEYLNGRSKQQQHKHDLQTEVVMLGLRMAQGVDIKFLKGKEKEIKELTSMGLIKKRDSRIAATQSGFNVLNHIIEKLTP